MSSLRAFFLAILGWSEERVAAYNATYVLIVGYPFSCHINAGVSEGGPRWDREDLVRKSISGVAGLLQIRR